MSIDVKKEMEMSACSDDWNVYEQGVRFELGVGGERNMSNAFEQYSRAADMGHIDSTYRLGRCYELGLGTEKELRRAMECYWFAAEAGKPEALVAYGRFLLDGIACTADAQSACTYFEKAANVGNADGCQWLAFCNENGLGCQRDLPKARALYQEAAQAGNQSAQAKLGRWCYYGIGGEATMQDAVKWLKLAATTGDCDSQYLLGMAYCSLADANASADATANQNLASAVAWLEKAAEQGHEDACLALAGYAKDGLLTNNDALRLSKATTNGFWQQVTSAKHLAQATKQVEKMANANRQQDDARLKEAVNQAVQNCQQEHEKHLKDERKAAEEREQQAVAKAVAACQAEQQRALEAERAKSRELQKRVESLTFTLDTQIKQWKKQAEKQTDSQQLATREVDEKSGVVAPNSQTDVETTANSQAQDDNTPQDNQQENSIRSNSTLNPATTGEQHATDTTSEQPTEDAEPATNTDLQPEVMADKATNSSEAKQDADPEAKAQPVAVSQNQDDATAAPSVPQIIAAEIPDAYKPDGLYRQGCAMQKAGNNTEAVALFTRGREQGCASCICALAECWERGQGCSQDREKAEALMREAADLGNPRAKQLLGRYEFTPIAEEDAPVNEQDNFVLSSLDVPMIWCRRGTFSMGSPKGWFRGGNSEKGRSENEVKHQVTLTSGFWLGKFQLTQDAYAYVAKRCNLPERPSQFHGNNLPVETVSWEDAQRWCDELTKIEREAGRLPDRFAYRLPTEAEWEYACRAGTQTPFYDGSSLEREDGICESLQQLAWFRDNSNELTHEVGLLKPNPWGFYDMHGNVSEWCLDKYEELSSAACTDPVGGFKDKKGEPGLRRIRRGGSWQDAAKDCRCASRAQGSVNFRRPFIGFRLALGIELKFPKQA